MKWLAVAGAVLLLGLFLLWREVRTPSPSPAAAAPAPLPARPAPPPPSLPSPAPSPSGEYRPAGTLAPEDEPGAIAKYSDEFWERVDEVYARRLLEYAAPCYSGGLHRKAKLKIAYHLDITDGSVAVKNARILESTLNDPKLEQCMLRSVSKAAFKDPRMPDWSSSPSEEETLVIRIELLKRFSP